MKRSKKKIKVNVATKLSYDIGRFADKHAERSINVDSKRWKEFVEKRYIYENAYTDLYKSLLKKDRDQLRPYI